MNIDQITLQHLEMPLNSPFETSFGRQSLKSFILVRIEGDGHIGFGESVALADPLYNEETTETVWYMLEKYLIPLIFQNEISSPNDVTQYFSPIRRNQMAKASIEGAIWDLYCKQKGISLSNALGGSKEEIDVGVSIGIEPSVDEVLRKVEKFIEDGYKKIKVKIKPGFDVEVVKQIRRQFGYDVPLMADANSAYSLKDLHILKELDQYQLMMIEQPLAHDDIIDHAKIQQELTTPICLDESIHSAGDARKAIELGSCKIINIKIGRVGGITEAIRIHNLCKVHNVPVWCGGMLESGIGRAHNIALTSLDNFTIPGDTSPSSRYWKEDIVEPEVVFSHPGKLAVPKGPGIGYTVREDRVEQYLKRQKTFNYDPKTLGV